MGAFSHRLFWPLALASVPFAYLGGVVELPTHIYKPLVGVVLIYAAWQSYRSAPHSVNASIRPVSTWVLVLVGALLGGLSGLTGVGGGIFLSPLLILCRWASTKVVSGISAAFILVNSIAGLLGVASKTLPVSGRAGLLGSRCPGRWLPGRGVRQSAPRKSSHPTPAVPGAPGCRNQDDCDGIAP